MSVTKDVVSFVRGFSISKEGEGRKGVNLYKKRVGEDKDENV